MGSEVGVCGASCPGPDTPCCTWMLATRTRFGTECGWSSGVSLGIEQKVRIEH